MRSAMKLDTMTLMPSGECLKSIPIYPRWTTERSTRCNLSCLFFLSLRHSKLYEVTFHVQISISYFGIIRFIIGTENSVIGKKYNVVCSFVVSNTDDAHGIFF